MALDGRLQLSKSRDRVILCQWNQDGVISTTFTQEIHQTSPWRLLHTGESSVADPLGKKVQIQMKVLLIGEGLKPLVSVKTLQRGVYDSL